MAIYIKNPEALRLAKELSALTGETMTTAITISLRERLEALEQAKHAPRGAEPEEPGTASGNAPPVQTEKT